MTQVRFAYRLDLLILDRLRVHRSQASPCWVSSISQVGFLPNNTISGCFLMCVFDIALGTTGFFKTDSANSAALGFLLLWVICYGCSAGPIGFVASGETSTPRLRAQTTSFNLGCYGLGL